MMKLKIGRATAAKPLKKAAPGPTKSKRATTTTTKSSAPKSKKTTTTRTTAKKAPAKRTAASSSKKAPAAKRQKAATGTKVVASKKTVAHKPKLSAKKPAAKKTTLTPERQKELERIMFTVKRNPNFKVNMIKEILKMEARSQKLVAAIPSLRELLSEQEKTELEGATETKTKRLEKLYDQKFAKLAIIEETYNAKPCVLQAKHEVFLRGIHPRKPPSSYMKFSKQVRAQIQAEHPTATFGQMGKYIGQAWKRLSDEEKEKFNKAAVDEVVPITLDTTYTEESTSSSSSSSSNPSDAGSEDAEMTKTDAASTEIVLQPEQSITITNAA